jgi:hypothetical protein
MFVNGNEGYTRMEKKEKIVIRRKEREAVYRFCQSFSVPFPGMITVENGYQPIEGEGLQ